MARGYSRDELERYTVEALGRIFERAIAEGSILYDPAGHYARHRLGFSNHYRGEHYEAEVELRIVVTRGSRAPYGRPKRPSYGPAGHFGGSATYVSAYASLGAGYSYDPYMDALNAAHGAHAPPKPKTYTHPYYEWVDKNP